MEEITREKGLDPDAIEIWFAHEARIGQKNKITRRWAKRGTRPSAPSDLRTASTYIFGAICPREGKAVGLILPKCNTETMQLYLEEIAKGVAQGRHAIIRRDSLLATAILKAAIARQPHQVSVCPSPRQARRRHLRFGTAPKALRKFPRPVERLNAVAQRTVRRICLRCPTF